MNPDGNKRKVSAKVALGETFRLALDALRSHKLRSFLTLLGIILAVATLVGVFFVPALFVLVERLFGRRSPSVEGVPTRLEATPQLPS